MKLFIALFVAILFSSCGGDFNGIQGSGNVTTQTRNIDQAFEKIQVNNGIDVVIEQSETKSVAVEADDNLLKIIETRVENGVLIIESNQSYNSEKTPKVTVKIPVITGLDATSGSHIESHNTLITENIKVISSSGSGIDINVEAGFISLVTESGSNIQASGKAIKLKTNSESGSEISASNLMVNEVDAEASSGSSTTVNPIVSLKASASSGSSILYKGTPKSISKEENSGGSVSN